MRVQPHSPWILVVTALAGLGCDGASPTGSGVVVRLETDQYLPELRDIVCDVTVRADDGAVSGPFRASTLHYADTVDYTTSTGTPGTPRGEVARVAGLVFRLPCPPGHAGEEVEVELEVIGAYPELVTTVGPPESETPGGGWPLYPLAPLTARAVCVHDAATPVTLALPDLTFGAPGHASVDLAAHIFDVAASREPPVWSIATVSWAAGANLTATADVPAVIADADTVAQRYTFACAGPAPEVAEDSVWRVELDACFAPPPDRPDATPLASLPGFNLKAFTTCGGDPPAGTLTVTPALWASDDPTDGSVRFGSLACTPSYACDPPEAGAPLYDELGRPLPTVTFELRCRDLDPDAAGPPTLHFDAVRVRCDAQPSASASVRFPEHDGLACPDGLDACGEVLHQSGDGPLVLQAAVERRADEAVPNGSLWRARVGLAPEGLFDRTCSVSAVATGTPAGPPALTWRQDEGLYPELRWSLRVGGLDDQWCGPTPDTRWEVAPDWGIAVQYAGKGSTVNGSPSRGLHDHFTPASPGSSGQEGRR